MQTIQLTYFQTQIHQRAMRLAENHRDLEAKLIEVLQEVDKCKLYKKLQQPSLFAYATQVLKLSEAVAYSFINVARKSVIVPELKAAVENKSLTPFKASRIASAITPENSTSLIQFAQRHTTREIDLEVVRQNPKAVTTTKAKPLSEEFIQVTITLPKTVYENMKRNESLQAQKGKKLTNGEALGIVLAEYLERHDPVKKAERASAKTASKNQSEIKSQLCANRVQSKYNNQPLTAAQKQTVNLRDPGRCTHINVNGERCNQDRWVHIHHVKSRSNGGSNDPSNLTTLCSFHHDLAHQLAFPLEGQITWLRSPSRGYMCAAAKG